MSSKRLVLVDASVEPGESERFVLGLPSDEPGLRVLLDEEPTATMVAHLGRRIASVGSLFPPSGWRERALLEEAKRIVNDAVASGPWKAYGARLRRAGLPRLEDAAVEMRFIAIYPALCQVTAIRDLLRSERWDRIEIFSTLGTLAHAWRIAARLEGHGGEIHETISRSRRTAWRRLRKRLGRSVRGFADLPLLLFQFLKIAVMGSSRKAKRAEPKPRQCYLFLLRPLEAPLYTATLAPLVNRAVREGRAWVLLDWRNLGASTAGKHGLEARHPSALFKARDYAGAIVDLGRIGLAWGWELSGGRAAAEVLHEGERLWPLVDWSVRRYWLREIFWMSLWQRAVRNAMDSLQPRGIVQADDFSRLVPLAVRLAAGGGIESFYVQPALISDSGRFDSLTARHAMLMDGFSRDTYEKRGVGAERLHVMGQIRWEGLHARTPRTSPGAIRQRLGLGTDQPFVFFAGSHGPIAEKVELIAAALAIVEAVPGAHLCAKPHPADPVENYAAFFPGMPKGVFSLFPSGVDMHDLILAADLTVTSFSNVAIEAAILDRPVLAINLRGEPDVIPFEEEGIAMVAHGLDDVKAKVARFFGDAEFRQALKESRDRYFDRNPQYRTPDVAGRILAKMDELTLRASPRSGSNEI